MTGLPLPLWVAMPCALLLIGGGLFALIGAVGLLRLRSFYARMHAPALGATLGIGCVVICSMLMSSVLLHRPVAHELLIIVFMVFTSPVSAMTLMRAAVSRDKS